MIGVPRLGFEWMRTNGVVECHSLHAPGREPDVPRTAPFGPSILYRTDEPALVEAPAGRTSSGDDLLMVGGTLTQYVFLDPPEVLKLLELHGRPPFPIAGVWHHEDEEGAIVDGPEYGDYRAFLRAMRYRKGRTLAKVRWNHVSEWVREGKKMDVFLAGLDLRSICEVMVVRGVMES